MLLSIHVNKHKQPPFAVVDIRKVAYLINHAEDHAILLPGRISGYHRTDLKFLPSSTTKIAIWEDYHANVEHTDGRIVGYISFKNIWAMYIPEN